MGIKNMSLVELVISASIGAILLSPLVCARSCADENDAKRAAYSAGWKDVNVTDVDYYLNFTCGEGELAYRISGNNPAGDKSNATVCCGYTGLKGCTIRY